MHWPWIVEIIEWTKNKHELRSNYTKRPLPAEQLVEALHNGLRINVSIHMAKQNVRFFSVQRTSFFLFTRPYDQFHIFRTRALWRDWVFVKRQIHGRDQFRPLHCWNRNDFFQVSTLLHSELYPYVSESWRTREPNAIELWK